MKKPEIGLVDLTSFFASGRRNFVAWHNLLAIAKFSLEK